MNSCKTFCWEFNKSKILYILISKTRNNIENSNSNTDLLIFYKCLQIHNLRATSLKHYVFVSSMHCHLDNLFLWITLAYSKADVVNLEKKKKGLLNKNYDGKSWRQIVNNWDWLPEAAARWCFSKYVFLKISQYYQKNNCVIVSF